MLGTSEERYGPGGSRTQHPHNSNHSQQQQPATAVLPHLATHPATAFPSFFSPYSHFQHLAALHTSFGGSNLSTTDLILNQTSAHTASLWPGSPTLSSTTNGHLPQTPSSAGSSGRVSAFDFYTNGQGEFSCFPLFILCLSHFSLSISSIRSQLPKMILLSFDSWTTSIYVPSKNIEKEQTTARAPIYDF